MSSDGKARVRSQAANHHVTPSAISPAQEVRVPSWTSAGARPGAACLLTAASAPPAAKNESPRWDTLTSPPVAVSSSDRLSICTHQGLRAQRSAPLIGDGPWKDAQQLSSYIKIGLSFHGNHSLSDHFIDQTKEGSSSTHVVIPALTYMKVKQVQWQVVDKQRLVIYLETRPAAEMVP